jgi:hypothetical protein
VTPAAAHAIHAPPHRPTARERLRAVLVDEHGVAPTVSVVMLFPLIAVLLFAGIQTVLWQHARTIAADRANQTAALVAVGDLTAADADSRLTSELDNDPDLADVDVTVNVIDTAGGQTVTVTVTAEANGIIIGTRTRISLTTATPVEAWQPLP